MQTLESTPSIITVKRKKELLSFTDFAVVEAEKVVN